MEKRYVVPEEMLEAVNDASTFAQNLQDEDVIEMLEVALRWLSKHPIVPSNEQWASLRQFMGSDGPSYWGPDGFRRLLAEWQSRMFLAPHPEAPVEIKDLLLPWTGDDTDAGRTCNEFNGAVIEAYWRGQKSGTAQ